MYVGVPSLFASVGMFCPMCNRPSAKVLCVYICKHCSLKNGKGSFTECIHMHKVCEPA